MYRTQHFYHQEEDMITTYEQALAMSKETGISIVAICAAVGISLESRCTATTLAEARKAYRSAPRGSEEEMEAMRKWRVFSAAQIAAATTLTEAREAYNNAPRGSEEEIEAIRKWTSLRTTLAEAR